MILAHAIVDVLLEASQPSAGDAKGVYVFGRGLPASGYPAPTFEKLIEQFREYGFIDANVKDSANLMSQLVKTGYTFIFKRSQNDIEVIGRIPVETSAAKYVEQYLGMEDKTVVQYRRDVFATPTKMSAEKIFSKEESQGMKPLNSSTRIGIGYETAKEGIKIVEVHQNGPAAQAGLKAGMILTYAWIDFGQGHGSDWYKLTSEESLAVVLSAAQPGKPLMLKILVGGTYQNFPVIPVANQQGGPQKPPAAGSTSGSKP
jgi:hypothetical protein